METLNHDLMFLILICAMIVVIVSSLICAVFSVRLYFMHNVKNQDGEYAWMIPSSFLDMQSQITKSQEKIVEAIAEASQNQRQVSKLLETLVNATLSLHQTISVDGVENGRKTS